MLQPRHGEARLSGSRLPELVRTYLDRCLPDRAAPRRIRVRQEGEMRKAPGAQPQRFRATQEFAVGRVEFSWHARFPIVRPIALHVRDEYADGAGRLSVRLLGYPIVRARGPEVTAGEALRYLAELPLVPYAMAHNRQLAWRDLEARAVEVSTVVQGKRLAAKLDFDEAGDLVRVSTDERAHQRRGGGFDVLPWGGEYSRYEVLGGMRMPTVASAYWDTPEGRFVYWSAMVTSAEALGTL
jgi:hypothetical protein